MLVQAQIKENIKAPRHCPLCGVTGEFTAQKASNAENISIWWRHHGKLFLWQTAAFLVNVITDVASLTPGGRAHLNIRTVFTDVWISIIQIRRSWHSLILIMGIPTLVRQHLFMEMTLEHYPQTDGFFSYHRFAVREVSVNSTSLCETN